MTVLLETDIKDNGVIHCTLVKYKNEDFIKREFMEWALDTFEHVKVSNLVQLKKEATEIAKSSYRGVANTVYLNEIDVDFFKNSDLKMVIENSFEPGTALLIYEGSEFDRGFVKNELGILENKHCKSYGRILTFET